MSTDITEIRKLAEQGDAAAQWKLGHAYLKGDGVEKNLDESAQWCLRAAEQGNAFRQAPEEAASGPGKAAAQNNTHAQKMTTAADSLKRGDLPDKESGPVKWSLELFRLMGKGYRALRRS